ncbi:putative F-box protein At3g52320 [Silene latifolia]|uniref:putative F-box protein At3g52320 n=1 Tax=Silene latifolia TaxID=37657 RepID=UPI003D7786A1
MVTSIVDSSMELNTGAASDSDDIPEEIKIEILTRLPSKSLSRLKRVSKHWNDTLTIQAFLVRHSRSYDKHPKLAFVARSSIWGQDYVISFELNDDNTPKTTTFPVATAKTTDSLIRGKTLSSTDFPMSNYLYMSNICNDLICLFNPNSTFIGLLNIRTRDFIKLPAITKKYVRSFKYWYALGFDPGHKVFKVLGMTYGRITSKECTNAVILTIGSNYWNPIDYKCFPSSLTKSLAWRSTTNSRCLDGVIYWVHKNTIDDVIVLAVFAYDLNCEAFRDYELVKTPMRDRTFRYYLTSLKERPTLFIWKIKNRDTEEVEQWTLINHKNPNAAWKMRNFTNHNFPIPVPYGSSSDDTPVAGGGILLLQYWKSINSECSEYLSYDLENFAIE